MRDPRSDFGFYLRLTRCMVDAKMKKEEIATAIGVSEATMINWLKGRAFPRWQSILKLSKLFGVSYWWLRTGEDPDV